MTKVKVSACQLEVKPTKSFAEFQSQVEELLDQVPADTHYIVFPELLTVGLIQSFADDGELEQKDLIKISAYTEDYIRLFSEKAAARKQVIIAGSHLEEANGKYLNTCYIFKEDGTYVKHSKTHIFPAEATWSTSEGDSLEVYEVGPAKIGIAICYESEIPEVSRILSLQGAEIIFCPSFTFTEAGYYRVRHCAQARCIENQVYFVHCPAVGDPGSPMSPGFGRSSILSPCDLVWNPNGVVAESEFNASAVVTGEVDLEVLHENRKTGAATTFYDRTRRKSMYETYEPYVINK